MQALHSSSALAYNVFEHWRGRDLAPLLSVLYPTCADSSAYTELRLEQTFRTVLRGTPPTLDVVLKDGSASVLAVESKFTEPYTEHPTACSFSSSYFAKKPGLWVDAGLAGCQDLACALNEKTVCFKRLQAAQLLKHLLGLASEPGQSFSLLYLWFEWPSWEADEHALEIETFQAMIGGAAPFRAMTYNQVFRALKDRADVDRGYLDYLEERYFTGVP